MVVCRAVAARDGFGFAEIFPSLGVPVVLTAGTVVDAAVGIDPDASVASGGARCEGELKEKEERNQPDTRGGTPVAKKAHGIARRPKILSVIRARAGNQDMCLVKS